MWRNNCTACAHTDNLDTTILSFGLVFCSKVWKNYVFSVYKVIKINLMKTMTIEQINSKLF